MPESGGAKPTTKKSKLGSKKTSHHHVSQSKVVERLNAASGTQSPSRTGSKSPLPHNGRPGSKSPQPQSKPVCPLTQTTVGSDAEPAAAVCASAAVATPAVSSPEAPAPAVPVSDPVVESIAPEAEKQAAPVVQQKEAASVIVEEKQVPKAQEAEAMAPTPESAPTLVKEQNSTKSVDDLFPDMVWEDDVTDLLATTNAVPLTVPAVLPEIRMPDPEPRKEGHADSKSRSKKEKSPRRQKGRSPAPPAMMQTPAKEVSPPAPTPASEQLEPTPAPDTITPVCDEASKVAVEVAIEKDQKSDVEPQAVDTVQSMAACDSPPTPLSPSQADSEKVSASAGGQQAKSKRKKNKSRSEDDGSKGGSVDAVAAAPASATTTKPAVSAPAANTIASDIKQIREQISQTLVSNIPLYESLVVREIPAH